MVVIQIKSLLAYKRPIEDDGPTDADLDEITEGAALLGLSVHVR